MADEFTIEQIRKAIADRIANIETAKQKHGTTDFLGGYEDAAMMRWLLDRLEKAEAECDAAQAAIAAAMMGAVKPLVWEKSLTGRWIGTPPVKLSNLAFWIFQHNDGRYHRHIVGHKGPVVYDTLEAAKAAAEADWQARNAAIRVIPTDATAALEAVKAEVVKATLDAAHQYIFMQYDIGALGHPSDREIIINSMKGGE